MFGFDAKLNNSECKTQAFVSLASKPTYEVTYG